MEFGILGTLEVVEEGRRLAPRPAKQRALLAMLLLHANKPVPIDVLVEALWAGSQPATELIALYGYVSALRRLLGSGRIETRRPGYVLHVEPGTLDAERFES